MYGTFSAELEVNAPASLVWKVYGTLEVTKIVEKQLTDVIDKIEVVKGDGSVGTILKVIFRPGVRAFTYCNEKFTKVDTEKMVKAELVKGGHNQYLFQFEIIENDEKSCITKSTIEYDVKEDSAANASFASIEPLKDIMRLNGCSFYIRSFKFEWSFDADAYLQNRKQLLHYIVSW